MIHEGRELPDPLELIINIDGPRKVVGYACPKCGAVFYVSKHSIPEVYESNKKSRAREASSHCVKDCPCGVPIEDSYRLRCRACSNQMEADKERSRFEKSKKLTIEEYDGPVYWDGHSGSLGDGYFAGIDEVLDHCEDEGEDVPEYVWACESSEFKLDGPSIVEHELENSYEEAFDHIPTGAMNKLQAYLDVWTKEQNIVSWHQDTSRSVLLREAAEPAMAG